MKYLKNAVYAGKTNLNQKRKFRNKYVESFINIDLTINSFTVECLH